MQLAEVLVIVDLSKAGEPPRLRVAALEGDENRSLGGLLSHFQKESYFVRETCWDFVANKILESAVTELASGRAKRSYLVISNRPCRNRQYAEKVVRHFVRNRRQKQEQFLMLSENPLANFQAWRQGFALVKIRDTEKRRKLYEAIDSASGI